MAMTQTKEDRWLSLGRACEILGINESTLRHWANTGRVRSFRTVGGHRRFSREDIYLLLQRSAVATEAKPETSAQSAVDKMRRRIQRRRAQPEQWLQHFDEEGRGHMRVLGRRLVALATEYMTQRRRRGELEEEARYLGLDYGRELASRKIGLGEAISAFIFFRNSLHESIKLAPGTEIVALEDNVLTGLAAVYEQPARTEKDA